MPFGEFRALWRAFVPNAFRAGYSFRRAIREARAWGIKIRTATALEDWREITGLRRYEARIRALDPRRYVPRAWIEEVDLRRARKYRVFGDVIYRHRETGMVYREPKSFYFDEFLPKSGFEEVASGFLRRADYMAEYEVEGFEISAVQHNRGLPY